MPLFIKGRAIREVAPFSATLLDVDYYLYDEALNESTGNTTEIAGRKLYYHTFTPDAAGDWMLVLFCAATGETHTFHYPVYDDQMLYDTTIDLHQAAGTYDIATATTGDVLIESLVISPQINVSDDATITYITVQTNTTTAQTLIDSALGAKANLTQEAQLAWTGSVLLRATDKIQFTIAGGSADADPTTCDVIIKYQVIDDGGYLA